ncbi:MAG TPA: TonB family protein [Terriglobia bacterium]|nr:TonB family protein [Terriglobia bacterium]
MKTRAMVLMILVTMCGGAARAQSPSSPAGLRGAPQSADEQADTQGTEPPALPKRIRVGGNVMEAKLVNKVVPAYPPPAKMAHVEGTVILNAVIGRDGAVKDLKIVSGHPLLAQAAVDAVRRWRYQTTLLNGDPVEVETEIDVNFTLARSDAAGTPANLTVDAERVKAEKAALDAVDPATVADIRQMVDLAGVKAQMVRVMNVLMGQLRPLMIGKLPASDYREQLIDEVIANMTQRFSTDEFIDLYIPVMARHFSDDEIKGIIAFYESPVGRHYVQEQPAVSGEFQAEMTEHWQKVDMPQLMSEMMQKIKADHPELEEKTPQH